MKFKTTMKAIMLFILFLPAWAVASPLGELRLSLIEGDVQIKSIDTGEWTLAAINLPLKDGDQLWVPADGRAEVETRRGTIVRLDERSLLDILTVDNDALQFYLSEGLAYVNARGGRGTTLQIDTPVSSMRVYDRAKFSAYVSDQGDTEISVYLGEVLAENKKGETRVDAGNMLSLGENSADLSPLGLADAWEQWNKDQDRALEERRQSERYLPEELYGYSRDFDDNGEWLEDPSYGRVWRPTLHISVDWSPYRHGRWVWIGDDYVWIAQERWGWAPYHYGRWFHVPRYGWCWVPPARHEVYWGPGYVGWVRTPTYVAWVPLAPREIYYGHGNYGPHSVNIVNVNINKIVIQKNVYKNVHVRNSVTVIHNETFVRGKKVDFKVRENPFLKERISVGRPQIKPERATRIAVLKDVPQVKAPPEKARQRDMKELKKERRLVKTRDKSVFQPDSAARVMPIEKRKEPKPRVPRKERVRDVDTRTAPSLAPGEDLQKTPAVRERKSEEPAAPPTDSGRKGRQQKLRIGEEVKQPGQDQGDTETRRQPVEPRPPREKVQPPPATREVVPAEPSAQPPESKRRFKPRLRPEGQEIQPGQDQGDAEIKPQPAEPPAVRRELRTVPVERKAPPVEPSAPPPETRRKVRRMPPPEPEVTQPEQDNRRERIRKEMRAPIQGQEAQPAPQVEEAPPISTRVKRPPPPPRVREVQPAPEGDGGGNIRQQVVPARKQRRVKPPPADATEKEGEEEVTDPTAVDGK